MRLKDIRIDYHNKSIKDIERCEKYALYAAIGRLQYTAENHPSKDKTDLAKEILEAIREELSDVLIKDEHEKGAK